MSQTIPDPKSMICKKHLFTRCREIEMNGSCKYAHSDAELKIGFLPGSLANYKTESCTNIRDYGKCIFGAGCYYYHNEAEKREAGQAKRGTPCPFFSRSGACYFLEPDVPESCPFDH